MRVLASPSGAAGAAAVEWKKLRIADAVSGDFTTPGYDANAPSQWVSGSEDGTGITMTLRNRTALADEPNESLGWLIDPASVFADWDADDFDQQVMFRITPVTEFEDSSLAWMGCGLTADGVALPSASAQYLGGQVQRIGTANSNRHGITDAGNELGFNSQVDGRPLHVITLRSSDALAGVVPWTLDGAGVLTLIAGWPNMQGQRTPSYSGNVRFFIAAGVEDTSDDANFTGKYELEVARWSFPAGSFP